MAKENKKKNDVVYTTRHFDILDYVYRNGQIAVEVAASTVGQNKNFYLRVQKLEREGLVTVIREEGFASLFNLTLKGEKVYKALSQHYLLGKAISERKDFKKELFKELLDEMDIAPSVQSTILKLLQ